MSGEASAAITPSMNGADEAQSSSKHLSSESRVGISEGLENTLSTNEAIKGEQSPSQNSKASKGGKDTKSKGKSMPAKSSGGTKTGDKPKLNKEKNSKGKSEKDNDNDADKKGVKNTVKREIKVPNREAPKNPPTQKEVALAEMSAAQRRRVTDLEKKEKLIVAEINKNKAALEGMTKKVTNVKWPVRDELVLDKLRLAQEQGNKGKQSSPHLIDEQLQPPLPSPEIPILLTNQGLACDVISCWDFMTVFGTQMELNPMSLDHFTELLQYEGGTSPAFVEVFTAPLRIVLADEALANRLSISLPLEHNFARKETSAEAQIAALEESFAAANVATENMADNSPGRSKKSQILSDIRNARRDFRDLMTLCSRMSLLPRALTDNLLNEPLEWQEILAGVFLYLPPVARLLRLNAELLDELTALASAEAEAASTAKAQGQPDSMDTVESVGMSIDGDENSTHLMTEASEAMQRTNSVRRRSMLAGDDSDDEEGDLGLNMDNAWVLTGDIRASLKLCVHALRALTSAELYTASTEAKVFILKALFESCCDTACFRNLLSANQQAIQEKRAELRKEAAAREAKKKDASKDLRKLAERLCREENEAKAEAKDAARRAIEARKEEAARKKAEKEALAKEKAKTEGGSKGKNTAKDVEKNQNKKMEKEKEKEKMDVQKPKGVSKSSKASDASKKATTGSNKDPYSPSPQQIDKKVDLLRLLRLHNVDEIREEPPVEDVSDSEAEEEKSDGNDCATVGIAASKKKGLSRQETAERQERKKRREQELTALEDAEYQVAEALESGLERDLKRAAKDAEQAGLVWYDEDEDKRFCVPIMLKVYKALQDIRKAAEKVKADMELDEVLQEYVVRSEPLGYDRYFNEYYCFKGDRHRLYVRIRSELPSSSLISSMPGDKRLDRPQYFAEKLDDNEGLRRLYETRPMKVSNPAVATWGIYGSAREIYYLTEALDERGTREKALKLALKGKYEGISEAPQEYRYDHEWIGRRVKRIFPGTRALKPAIGIVDGWLPDNEPEEGDEAVWHIKYKDGDEEELDLKEMNRFLIDGPNDNMYFTPPLGATSLDALSVTDKLVGSIKVSNSSASLAGSATRGVSDKGVIGGHSLTASPSSKAKGGKNNYSSSTSGGARFSKPVDVQLYMQRYLDPLKPEQTMDTEDGNKADMTGKSLSGRTIKATKTYGQELQQQQQEEEKERALNSAKIKAQLVAKFRHEEPEVCVTYSNSERGYKHQAASRENIGLSVLKTRLQRCLSAVATGMKREGLQTSFTRDVKSALAKTISVSTSAEELSSVVIELEGYVHQIQEKRGKEDVNDQNVANEVQRNNHEALNRDMWLMEPSASPYIGRIVRCFFSRTGGSNGIVVGFYDKAKMIKEKALAKTSSSSSAALTKSDYRDEEEGAGPSETAQYMIEHEDGEMEVMTEKVLLKNIRNFEEYMANKETEAHLFSFFEDADIDPDEAKSYKDELEVQMRSHIWHVKHRIVPSAFPRGSRAAVKREASKTESKSKSKTGTKGNNKSRKRARDEDETESENDSVTDDATTTIWPSSGVRLRWQDATRASRTVASVALSLSTFVANAVAFDAISEEEIYF